MNMTLFVLMSDDDIKADIDKQDGLLPSSPSYTIKDHSCFNWAWSTQLRLESMLSHALRRAVWIHGTPSLDSSNMPAFYQGKSYNVPDCYQCPLKVYDVPASYQSVSQKLTMCLLVIKSFTKERPLKCLSLTVPLFVNKHPILVDKVSPKNKVRTCLDMREFLIATEEAKLS